MLYLVEVKKQTKRFMGGLTTELKLLAFERNDQTWSAVLGEEIVIYDELNALGEGALLMVNLENRQVKEKPKLAGPDIVRILQSLSRVMGNSKDQEEEIEQWRQSLTYQSQELNRRDKAIVTQQEQLKQQEANLQQKDRELQEAWESLKQEQQSLAQLKQEVSLSVASSDSSTAAMKKLVERLHLVRELVNRQQANWEAHQQQIEPQRTEIRQQQREVDRQSDGLNRRKQEVQSLQTSLEEARVQLQVQRQLIQSKEELLRRLNFQRQGYDELHQTLVRLAGESEDVDLQQKVDIEAIENMPLQELQEVVNNLRADLEKLAHFVSEEEEELALQTQTIRELEKTIETASDYESLNLETELAEELERKKMLDETIVGQRRNLRERDDILRQHWRILQRRQGKIELEEETQNINLAPLLLQLEDRQDHLEQEISQTTTEIERIQGSLEQFQGMIEQQSLQYQAKVMELQQTEEKWQKSRVEVAQLQSEADLYTKTLQELQDNLHQIGQNLEDIEQFMTQINESSDTPNPAFA